MLIRNVKHILGPTSLIFSGFRGCFPGVREDADKSLARPGRKQAIRKAARA